MAREDDPRPGDATTFAAGAPARVHDDDPQSDDPCGSPRDPAWAPGGMLGRFRLERLLGRGGMGEVFAARDGRNDTLVALKTLANTQPALRTRFKREFRALADVEHPNLVRFGELVIAEDGPSFFTMELLDGQPFTRWVRADAPPGQLPDLERLAEAFTQLLAGLERLHAAGFVHRDLKPSNVLVTPTGRVVILDFGIIADLGARAESASGAGLGRIIGTPLYMAPEQAAGLAVEPAADLYAVGVMLYECLTGALPFSGPVLQVLMAKQDQPAPDPQQLVAAIPATLRDGCLRLLAREPGQRPSLAELRARLASHAGKVDPRPALAEVPFIGRELERAALAAALLEVRQRRRLAIVHLRGRSGHGKSTLIRRFLAAVVAGEHGPAPLILRGRCRERESVPYKGVDAVVDALALHLRGLPPARRDSLRPRYAEALAQVFPAFEELWSHHAPLPFDPQEARGLGWAALRELLTRLSADVDVGVVLVIDDFQWSDPDSVALLRAVLHEPEAPALLLLLATRDAITGESIRAWLDDPAVRRVELGPLTQADARDLALSLLLQGQAGADPSVLASSRPRAETIALRSGGSPFFIGQMVLSELQDESLHGERHGEILDLDQIVARRLARLDAGARAALEVVAVAGGPIRQALLLSGRGDFFPASSPIEPGQIDALCRQGLLVRSEGEDPRLEVAHDRIRETSLAALDPRRRRSLHGALALGLIADKIADKSADKSADRSAGSPDDEGVDDLAIGDEVFAIVDHIAASMADDDDDGLPALLADPGARRRLAALHRLAGDRAANAGAWGLARRAFAVGVDLVAPWLADAARGDEVEPGLRSLCLALAFGHAQAEAMTESADADAAFEALLAWSSLSQVELGQIAARRVAIVAWFNRLEASVEIGYANLARLGLPLGRNPSLLAGAIELLRGWLALGRRDLAALLALPPMDDANVRAQIDVLIEVSFVAPYVDPQLILTIAGVAVRMIRRHGYHPGLTRALVQMALAINALGKSRAAAALCDRALAMAARRPVRPIDLLNARVQAQYMIWPASRPLPGLLTDLEDRYREACDLGRTFEAGYMAVAAGFALFEIDRPLHAVSAMFDRFEQRNPDLGHTVNRPGVAMVRRHLLTLIEGAPPLRTDELGPTIPFLRYLGLTVELTAAFIFADYPRATAAMDAMPADYDDVMLGVLQIPRHAMTCALLEARRCPSTGRGRRRALWRIRRHLRTARRWAEQGPENYGPMAKIIEGELAAVRGRDEQAHAHFVQASADAERGRASSLVALANLRLAALAHRRGDASASEAAFAEALATYDRWGAVAVAARLRALGRELAL